MTKVNEGTAAVSAQQLAAVRSTVRRARRTRSIAALARASGLSSHFVGLVARGKKGVTQASAQLLFDGAAKLNEPSRKPGKMLTGEPFEELVRDVRAAIDERFGGNVEVLARAVNAPVELVRGLLSGAHEIAASDARKFAPFRAPKAPAVATAFVSTPLEQARAMLPVRLRETHGLEALVHVRAVLSRAEEKPVEKSALALVRKWGPEAISHVLGEAERGLASMGGA